jgi:hypothetical protein
MKEHRMAIRRTPGYAQMSETGEWFILGNLPHAEEIEGIVPGLIEFDDVTQKLAFVPTGNPKVREGTIVTTFSGFDKESREEMAKRGELGRVDGFRDDKGADLPAKGGVSMLGADADALAAIRAETDAKLSELGLKLDMIIEAMTRQAALVAAPAPLGDSDSGDALAGAMGVIAGASEPAANPKFARKPASAAS